MKSRAFFNIKNSSALNTTVANSNAVCYIAKIGKGVCTAKKVLEGMKWCGQ